MKKIKCFELVMLLFLISFAGNKLSVAVIELDAEGVEIGEAKTLTTKLRSELMRTGNFDVIERDKMNEILKEQGFQQTGCTTQECVIQIGRLIGVSKIIAGSVGKIGSMYVITVRIVNVENGKIENSVEYTSNRKIEDLFLLGMPEVASKLFVYNGTGNKRPFYNNMSSAVSDIVTKRVKVYCTLSLLRTGPSPDSTVYKVVKHGDILNVLAEFEDYYQVVYLGNKYWIKKNEVEDIND